MLYASLRWTARMALRWFYRDVAIDGIEHVPARGPLLVVANHPNQLVDAMLVGTTLPRDVTFTGKAILLDNPLLAVLMRRLPFVPLRRAQDERKKRESREAGTGNREPEARPAAPSDPGSRIPGPALDTSRNADAFRAIHDALALGQAVLIFPEGISHHQPQLAPIKTGAARIALAARDERGIRDLRILPVGLNFEDKAAARTRVLVRIGAPIALDDWRPRADAGGDRGGASSAAASVDQLTREVDAALRAVTLNFAHEDDRRRVLDAARLLSGLFTPPGRLGAAEAPLDREHETARRVEHVRQAAATGSAALQARVARFETRLDAFRAELVARRLPVADLEIDFDARSGARFAVREGARVLAGAPLALWGRVNHWLPLRLAQALARRTSRTPEDPAMHTIVLGLVLVLVFYLAQAALVAALAGPWWALAYVVSLPASATRDFRLRDYVSRARDRSRAYRTLRRDTALRERLQAEMRWLRAEASAIEEEAGGGAVREVVVL